MSTGRSPRVTAWPDSGQTPAQDFVNILDEEGTNVIVAYEKNAGSPENASPEEVLLVILEPQCLGEADRLCGSGSIFLDGNLLEITGGNIVHTLAEEGASFVVVRDPNQKVLFIAARPQAVPKLLAAVSRRYLSSAVLRSLSGWVSEKIRKGGEVPEPNLLA